MGSSIALFIWNIVFWTPVHAVYMAYLLIIIIIVIIRRYEKKAIAYMSSIWLMASDQNNNPVALLQIDKFQAVWKP